MEDRRKGKELGWVAAVAAVSLLFHLLYFRHGVQNLVDLGVVCVDSERILDGQVPGRDFVDSYGPARFYLTALAFWIAGPSLLTFSTVCLLLLSVKDVLVYLAARCLLRRPFALYVAGLAIVVHGPLHKVFLTLAAMAVLYPAFLLVRSRDRGAAFRFGAAVALAGLLRYDVGAAGAITGVILLVLLARIRRGEEPGLLRQGAAFSGGLALVLLPMAACFLAAGVNPAAVAGHHLRRLYSLEQANVDLPSGMELPFQSDPEHYLLGFLLILTALVLLGTAAAAVRLARGRNRDPAKALLLLAILIMSIFLLNQVRLGVKFGRLSQVSPPLFMALAFLLQCGLDRMRSGRLAGPAGWMVPGAALAFFAALAGYIWTFEGFHSQDSFATLRMAEHYVDHPRARCFFKRRKGMEIEEVISYLERAVPAGEAIFTGAACPLFHFLSDRKNPTPFTDFTFYYFNEENQRRVIASLEMAGVMYIVDWPRQLTGFWFEESAPVLMAYLKSNFSVERRIGRFVIYKRK